MKEKILNAFKALGFELKDLDGMGCGFEYEGKRFIFMYDEDDEDFLNIALPVMLEKKGEDDIDCYKMLDKLNGTLKYVKAHLFIDGMWLFYERELFGDEDLKKVIGRMIIHLDAGFAYLCRLKAQEKQSKASDNSEATDANDNEDAA